MGFYLNKKKLIFTFVTFLSLSQNVLAGLPVECGVYDIHGKIIIDLNRKITVLLNANSKSETRLQIDFAEGTKVALFIDKDVSLSGTVYELDGSIGKINKITKVSKRIPNPLMPNDNQMKLINSKVCLNE